MNSHPVLAAGSRVSRAGFEGTVLCILGGSLAGMADVRLARGDICTSITELKPVEPKQLDTTARRWRAADRPLAVIRDWPHGLVRLTAINSRTVYWRSPHVVGELAAPIDRLIAIKE